MYCSLQFTCILYRYTFTYCLQMYVWLTVCTVHTDLHIYTVSYIGVHRFTVYSVYRVHVYTRYRNEDVPVCHVHECMYVVCMYVCMMCKACHVYQYFFHIEGGTGKKYPLSTPVFATNLVSSSSAINLFFIQHVSMENDQLRH